MYEVWFVDVLLLLVLLSYTYYGFRNGFVNAIAGFIGLTVGAVVAFFFVPIVGNWVHPSSLRLVVVLAVAIGLVVAGHAAGVTLGSIISRGVRGKAIRLVDRILGAVVSLVATALVLSVLGASLAGYGIPLLSKAIAQSTVLRTISALTPDPVEGFLAQARSMIVRDGLPAITEALGGIVASPGVPQVDTGKPALQQAAQSVVRITGTAPACGQSQSGSGFVIADDRVVTNAHVVSGVTEPVIESPDGQVLSGTIVYFDPNDDLAVIAVPGLSAATLTLGETAADGAKGVVDGYPYGGPFISSGAEVLSVDTVPIKDIYGQSSTQREVYTLATQVREGDSGGPFLGLDGSVVGVVFARSANSDSLGYAMTMAELTPVAAKAPGLSAPVASGSCVRG